MLYLNPPGCWRQGRTICKYRPYVVSVGYRLPSLLVRSGRAIYIPSCFTKFTGLFSVYGSSYFHCRSGDAKMLHLEVEPLGYVWTNQDRLCNMEDAAC